MNRFQVRPVEPADAQLILDFITDLAIYEKAEHEVKATPEMIRESLFGDSATAQGLICLMDDKPIGYAVFFFNYSTWLGKNGIYLEDLYVDPAFRGKGGGKFLFQYLAKIAVEKGCGRFEWSVLDWNTPAIDFYESFGARPMTEWVGYRLEGEALQRFAGGS